MTILRRTALILLSLMLSAAACGGEDPSSIEDVTLGGERSASPDAGKQSRLSRDAGSRETLVAALGDSITAGSPRWDPDEAVRAGIGSSLDPESQYEYWVERRLPGVRFRNCGVLGERSDQIAARLEECAKGAQVLIVQGGINDIAQMRRVKTAAQNLRGMVRRGKELDLRVALAEVLPWNNGYPTAAARIRRLNRLIGRIGREEGVPVFPWYGRLEDPQAPGRMRRELTIDGDHPSVEGYRRIAAAVELP